MSSTYTQPIASGETQGSGSQTIYTVATGEIVVIRNIDVAGPATYLLGRQGFTFAIGGSIPFFGISAPEAGGAQSYHWEGRLAMLEGTYLTVTSPEGSWSFQVTGYVFNA